MIQDSNLVKNLYHKSRKWVEFIFISEVNSEVDKAKEIDFSDLSAF